MGYPQLFYPFELRAAVYDVSYDIGMRNVWGAQHGASIAQRMDGRRSRGKNIQKVYSHRDPLGNQPFSPSFQNQCPLSIVVIPPVSYVS